MSERLTQPKPYDGQSAFGGVGVVPRRQQDPVLSGLSNAAQQLDMSFLAGNFNAQEPGTSATALQYSILSTMAENMPLRLLRLLMAQDGTAQMASLVKASLAFGARKVRFVAVKDWRKGRGEIDDDGTMELERVFGLYQTGATRSFVSGASIAAQMGSAIPTPIPYALPMLLHASERLDDTGQVCFEATGDLGTGVTGIYDFDALSCRYRDGERRIQGGAMRGVRFFEQQQRESRANERTGQVEGWRLLTGPGISSVSWKASSDNPYGTPAAGAALSYLLRKAARRRDLSDWLHAVAWPKVIVEQMVSALYRLAAEQPSLLVAADRDSSGNLRDITPDEWVGKQVLAMQKSLASLKSDDVWMIGEGKAYGINPSGIQGLTDVLTMERLEEIQSYNLLPALVGVTDGGTQAYAEVQWLAQTQMLALHAAYAAAGPVAIGNYHFRLLGLDMIVRAEFDDLPPLDPQSIAEARKTIAALEEHLAAIGINGPDDYALRVSESGAADPERLAAYLTALLARLSSGGNSS
jgi:hypothetical protein